MKNINYNKDIYEGWKVIDFIERLEPMFDMVNSGQSWQEPFKNQKELKDWCKDNQPYYKKHIPEVYKYFLDKVNFA
jgi:hypothetical protein